MKKRRIMLQIGRKKFFSPHLCPDCGKLMVIIKNPCCTRCIKCQRKFCKKHPSDKSIIRMKQHRKKYNKKSYKFAKKLALTNQGYCALCGGIEDLTAHHTCNVKTGEWQGKHLTILCSQCHRIWEKKVNVLRNRGI